MRRESPKQLAIPFNVTVDGEITATLDDPEKVIDQINDLFNVAEKPLNDQVDRAGIVQTSNPTKPEPASPNRNSFSSNSRFNNGHSQESATDYIERFYNRVRLHSAIGYVSPNDYEKQLLREIKASGNLPSSEPFVGRSPERRPTRVTEKHDFKLPLLVDSESRTK